MNTKDLPAGAWPNNGPVRPGRYRFDHPQQRLALADGSQPAIRLTHREAGLLKCLLDQRNQVLTRTDVLRALWGNDSFFNGRSLAVFITPRAATCATTRRCSS